jgi:hypothetical protein
MKLLLAFIFLFSLNLFADGGSSERILLLSQQKQIRAGISDYFFKLYDKEKKKNVTDADLQITHTKKLHFVVYDRALKEFSHLHPVNDGKYWKVELNLPVNGSYFIWAQGQLSDGEEFSSLARAEVVRGKPANIKLPLGDVRTGTDSLTKLELANVKLKANQMATISFKVSRADGSTPVMSPYLGALAHVIATPATGDELLHVHPMSAGEPNSGILHASFPQAGEYRIWIQFIEHDELKTIPLSVIVN